MATGVEKQPNSRIVPESIRGILAGTASGVAKLVVGHPFDTIKVRLQTEGGYGRFRGPIHCLVTTIRTEGVRALYKGATPPLFGWGIMDSVMVGTYSYACGFFRNRQADPTQLLPLSYVCVAGIIGGIASVSVVTPIELVKARLQVQYADPSTKRYSGPIDCIKKLVKSNGLTGLYKGFTATLLFRSFCGSYFASYEFFKRDLLSRKERGQTVFSAVPVPMINFIAGGLGAAVLWTLAFPFDVVKNRMMVQPDGPDRPFKTLRECFAKLYQQEGFKGFYRGFVPCMLRSFPANGAAFLAIELTMKYLP